MPIISSRMGKLILVFTTVVIVNYCKGQNSIKSSNETISLNSDTLYCQEEVTALETNKGELLVAWIDRKKGTEEKTVSYMVSINNKTQWTQIKKHDNSEYIWTGNPTLAKDDVGNLYIVDMSTNYQKGKFPNQGVFEYIFSKDEGKTWSDWKIIVKNSALNKNWPDKPSIIAKGDGELYLVYNSFDIDTANFLNTYGKVVFQKSKDHGTTWTTPIEIKSERKWKPSSIFKAIITGGADLGEQGTSLYYYDNKIYVSWGSYNKKGIYFTCSNDYGNSFELAKKITPSKVNVPVTQLLISKNKWEIFYHTAHGISGVYCIESLNNGKTWKTIKVDDNASLISGAIDSNNNIHTIWNKKKGNKKMTYYRKYTDKARSQTIELTKKEENKNQFFIGAYQQILIDSNQKKHIFWIDWQQNGGKLKYTIFQ